MTTTKLTDLELMQAAAQAVGMRLHVSPYGTLLREHDGNPYARRCWNPLHDNADAFDLLIRIKGRINTGRKGTVCAKAGRPKAWWVHELIGDDLAADARRAIVYAAAQPITHPGE